MTKLEELKDGLETAFYNKMGAEHSYQENFNEIWQYVLDNFEPKQVSVEPVVKPACEQYQLLIDALVNILNEDGHQWSTRPCPTCRVITAVIGKPFGCDKRRLSKSV